MKVFKDNKLKIKPIATTSSFLRTMEKLLLLSLQPELNEHIDQYHLSYKCKRSTLDAGVVLYSNAEFSLDLDHTFSFGSIFLKILNKFVRVDTNSKITSWLCFYPRRKEQCPTSPLTDEGIPQNDFPFNPLSPFKWSAISHRKKLVEYVHWFQISTFPMKWTSSLTERLSVVNGLTLNPSKC